MSEVHPHILKAVVVDDELLARENLKMMLADYCPEVKVLGDAGNIAQAKEVIESIKPDVVFLDIRMPSGAEGFDLLDQIPEKKFQVVFVTAFKDYAIKAFKANAIHYVLKPIDIEDLKYAVEKVVASLKKINEDPSMWNNYLKSLEAISAEVQRGHSSKISISHSKGIKIVEADSIVRLEADSNCTKLFFVDRTSFLDTRTLKAYEEFLNPKMFFRIHKSHIINLNHLSEYSREEGNFAVMNNGDRLPVSRAKLSEFISLIKRI